MSQHLKDRREALCSHYIERQPAESCPSKTNPMGTEPTENLYKLGWLDSF